MCPRYAGELASSAPPKLHQRNALLAAKVAYVTDYLASQW